MRKVHCGTLAVDFHSSQGTTDTMVIVKWGPVEESRASWDFLFLLQCETHTLIWWSCYRAVAETSGKDEKRRDDNKVAPTGSEDRG